MSPKKSKITDENTPLIFLSVVLVVVLLLSTFQLFSVGDIFSEKDAAKEPEKAKMEIITIDSEDCVNCIDLGGFTELIESKNVEITSMEELAFGSDEAKKIIEKFSIKQIPTVIMSGEVEESGVLVDLEGFVEEKNGDYLLTNLPAPYVDTVTGDIIGLVSVTYILNDDCEICQDIRPLAQQLELVGVSVEEHKEIAFDSEEGKEIIKKYDITRVPTLVLSAESKYYPDLTEAWEDVGTIEEDGAYVLRNSLPPYYDLDAKKERGRVNLISLFDPNCEGCYTTDEFHLPVLESMGLYLDNQEKVSVSTSRGKKLIETYDINLVPTVILTGEPDAYNAFTQVWDTVGTIEDDGAYVFRVFDVVNGPYKDLSTGEILVPEDPDSTEEDASANIS